MPFDGPDGYAAGLEAFARAVAPRRPLPTSEWARRYRWLSGKDAAEPGPWRNARIPYLVGPMDALDVRHPAPIVVLVGSSQVGKTQVGINWFGSVAHQTPALFLALFPSDRVARKWVRLKLDPALASSPVLAKLMPPGRKGAAGNTLSEKNFDGGGLLTGSAGIADDLRMTSCPYLLLEEIDSFVDNEEEGDPIERALRRLSNFPRSKAFLNSSPTTSERSRIWPYWLSSTMDRYFVPCTHCGHMQYLKWQQLKWTAGQPKGAGYLCEECAAFIQERNKTDMLAAGAWRSTHPEREDQIKGFHVNGLYTPIGLGDSWAKHAEAWERAQGSLARIQVFYNTRLGEVHKGERRKVEWEEIKRRAEPYPLRTIPKGVLLLTSFTDVQADRLETQVVGWGRNEVATVIDYVVHYGDTTRTQPAADGLPTVWQKLDDYLATDIANSFGVPMRLQCSLVDSGYLPTTVLWFTRSRRARGIYASLGSTNPTRLPIGKPSYPDVKRRGKKADIRAGAERYLLGVSLLKHWLYELLIADGGTPEAPVQPADRRVHFSADLEDRYYRQLTAEVWDPKEGWIQRANYQSNEALDTFIGARAAAMHHTVNVHRLREVDWQRLEQLYESGQKTAMTIAPVNVRMGGGFSMTSARLNKEPAEPNGDD